MELEFWPSENLSLGIAHLQGMSRGGMIATNGASSTRSKTRVLWGKYTGDGIGAQYARQYVTASKTYDNEERRYEHSHILQNWLLCAGPPIAQPYIAEQKFWGEKVYTPFTAGTVNSAINLVRESASKCQSNEDEWGEFTFRTVGIQSKIGDLGMHLE